MSVQPLGSNCAINNSATKFWDIGSCWPKLALAAGPDGSEVGSGRHPQARSWWQGDTVMSCRSQQGRHHLLEGLLCFEWRLNPGASYHGTISPVLSILFFETYSH